MKLRCPAVPVRPLALAVTVALFSGCSLHDRERSLDTADTGTGSPAEARTPQARTYDTEDVESAMQRQAEKAEKRAAETDDLWERARLNYGFSDELDHDRVQRYLDHYRDQPRIIELSTRRAEPFAYFILSELEARDMPAELLLLPIVESGYAPEATSSGRAAGIWQFIPSTGDHFDLHRDDWYDGRRDVYQSTLAALDYLEYLHSRFDDWYLALAAYNWGQGNVRRAMDANAAQGRDTDYWSLDLPAEPHAYVPRLLALRELFRAPDEHGVTLTPVANEPALEIIRPERQADLALVADMAELDPAELERLNPGYHRHATHPEHARHLFVPTEAADRLETALAEHGDDPLLRFREYTVRAGDNLGRIARDAGTEVAVVRQMNDLNGDLIRAGQTLRLPVGGDDAGATTAVAEAGDADSLTEYEVRRGDSLWTISQSTGMSLSELRRVNDLGRDTTLQPGDVLQVAAAPGDEGTVQYEVRPGDSLSGIARRFEVSVDDVRRWNGLNGDRIRAGETLVLHIERDDDATVARADT
ncbi:LysM peptidoglycan-binding domain-containing protein [Thioalkalivibrio sp. AKL17]|uniref:lytic transglycosylase n=1 Tax=Thioalkalivibrio sp. AKL17 TaxID=1158160 RepID=UPI000685C21A|nr:LysM peptidoglycan-binding domain-containing protein [Thioalkalivibrio sp. AKL17]